jgi:CHAT domain-containing protein
MLIRPFENRIKGKRLIIIPDGELGYLSFDMLLAERPAQKPESYHNLNWLINDYPLSYSSSATIFFEQLNLRSKKVRKNLLAFAPSYDFLRNRRNAGPSDSILMRLSPMVGTKEEVSAIAGLFSAKIRFDSKATETYFKDHAGEYNILHLAMHTIVDDQNPLYSKLIFTPDPTDSTNDGFLNTYELFNLSLPGQLAVLSACNTGSGKLERGEGILSLARGFFYAGIPNVVMTLWEIEDHSSADLMAIFYENLKKGEPSDIALQKAKITYLKNANKLLSHPYFWAGYVNIGKPGTVNASVGENSMYYVLGGIFMLVLMALAYFFINKRVFLVKKRH